MNRKTPIDWTTDEDLTLVEVVLRYIRTGKKMKDAWEECERVLPGRTAGACQFRWSSNLSKKYDASVEQAKLQRMSYKEILNNGGEETMTPEITLPKNRPINPMSDAMEKALEDTKSKRIGKTGLKMAKKEEPPVTTGVQQAIDFDKNEIADTKEEKQMENPFLRIRKFVAKMEREYGDVMLENTELKKDVAILKSQLHTTHLSNKELKEKISEAETTIEDLTKQVESYSEIKDLIKQFNSLHA